MVAVLCDNRIFKLRSRAFRRISFDGVIMRVDVIVTLLTAIMLSLRFFYVVGLTSPYKVYFRLLVNSASRLHVCIVCTVWVGEGSAMGRKE